MQITASALAAEAAKTSLLAACQAVDLRVRSGGSVARPLAALHDAVRRCVPPLDHDRAQDADIAALLDLLRRDELPIHPESPDAA